DPERALDYGRRALEAATALGDFALQMEANLRLAQVHHARGEYADAVDVLERSVAALKGDLTHERFGLPLVFSVGARSWLVRSLVELGEFDRARARAMEAVRLAEEADHPFSLAVADWALGHTALRRGDLVEAVEALTRSLELCRVWSIRLWLPRCAADLGSALALSGRVAEALPLLEQAVAQEDAMHTRGGHALWVALLSEGYSLAGRPADALRLSRRALGLACAHGEQGHQAWALRLVGEVEAQGSSPDLEQAAWAYGEALALAERLGMRPLVAHAHLGLGRLAERRGDAAGAGTHLAQARALFAELGMSLWQQRAGGP
ncbi:MAG TPA: tetratricopeptide repeat protein, partial [Methylomirabilota bacterium]|nr:tetratricopeptide repeat protein [Methylomirabilota bacterium]